MADVQRRKLGNSGIEVGPLAFGGNVFGWTVDEPRSFELLDAFAGSGLNLIDTAAAAAGPERRKQLRLKLFGPSSANVWAALAGEIGARFEPGSFWTGAGRVVAAVGPWQVVLDSYVVSSGETAITYTRLRAPYVNADGFHFTVYRKGLFTAVGKRLGMQDVTVGHHAFDDAFVIQGTSEPQLRRLFANPRLRALMDAQPQIHLTVKDDEGYFRPTFPAGVDELLFTVPGVIKDLDRLKLLYDLFAETLHTLCHIGSAYEDDPGMVLEG